MKDTLRCRQCDSVLDGNKSVCPVCGETLLQEEERQVHGEDYRMLKASMEKPLESDDRRNRSMLTAVAGVALFAIVLWDLLGR